MKTELAIEKLIMECERYILADIDYGRLKKFDFYGEVNTGLTTIHGIRKILLWVLDKKPNNCRRLSEDYRETPEEE